MNPRFPRLTAREVERALKTRLPTLGIPQMPSAMLALAPFNRTQNPEVSDPLHRPLPDSLGE